MKDIAPLQKLDIREVKKAESERRLEELKKIAVIERWRAAKTILLGIAMLAGICIAPNVGKAVYYFMHNTNDRRERYRIKKTLGALEREGFIHQVQTKKNAWAMALTKKGKDEVYRLKIPYLKLPQLKKWDGAWRLIISDIPEKHKAARDAFNRWLIHGRLHTTAEKCMGISLSLLG